MRRGVSRAFKILLAVLALFIIAIAASTLVPGPPRKLTLLLARDEVRELRNPLRPPARQKRVLLIAFDGFGDAQLKTALREGKLPTLKSLLGEEKSGGVYAHGYAASGVLSILPSTTMAAWSSVYSGKPASQTGVPGNEWFERERMRFVAPAPVSTRGQIDTLEMLTDSLVGDSVRVPTLFELADVRAYVSLAPVYRGADIFSAPAPQTVLGLFSHAKHIFSGEGGMSRAMYGELDEESSELFAEIIDREGPPDLGVLYFPGIDLYTHVAKDPLVDQLSYAQEKLDPAIGQVLEAYRRNSALEGTSILLVADHGHTPVRKDDRHSLHVDGKDEPTEVLSRAGYRVRPNERDPEPSEEDYQAAIAYQGAFAYVYLADRSTCSAKKQKCEWQKAPRLNEDVLPAARAFYEANQEGGPIPQMVGTLDLVFAREGAAVTEESKPFKVFDGEKLVPIAEYLARQPRPDLLELEARLSALAVGPYGHRAGDVLLLARSRIDDPIDQRFYFSKPYTSWHGSPSAQDSFIPLVLIREGASGEALRQELHAAVGEKPSQLSIAPLINALLGVQRREARSGSP
jgi:Type I phosphodiesterase / nucleotide pyrophosphatase